MNYCIMENYSIYSKADGLKCAMVQEEWYKMLQLSMFIGIKYVNKMASFVLQCIIYHSYVHTIFVFCSTTQNYNEWIAF